MRLEKYITNCYRTLPVLAECGEPWEITGTADKIVRTIIESLRSGEFNVEGLTAIHKTAKEDRVQISLELRPLLD